MNEVKDKLKEVLFSVLPITTIVLILHFTISPLDPKLIYLFLVGSIMVIVGLTVFLIGIDQGIENIGRGVGNVIARSNSYCIAITVSLILGFFISFAEPDLHILAKQVSSVTDGKFNNMLMVTPCIDWYWGHDDSRDDSFSKKHKDQAHPYIFLSADFCTFFFLKL